MVGNSAQQTMTMMDQVQTMQGLGAVDGGTVHEARLTLRNSQPNKLHHLWR